MGKSYKTTRLAKVPSVKKINDEMKKKRLEAMKIIKKSRTFDTEVRFLILTIAVIVLMFAALPFFIVWKNKRKNNNNANGVNNENVGSVLDVGGGMTTPSPAFIQPAPQPTTIDISNVGNGAPDPNKLQRIMNDAGTILTDVSHSELFNT